METISSMTGKELLQELKKYKKYENQTDYYIKKSIGISKLATVNELKQELISLSKPLPTFHIGGENYTENDLITMIQFYKMHHQQNVEPTLNMSNTVTNLNRDIIYNIIINTKLYDLISLYLTDQMYQQVLNESTTLNYLYDKFIGDDQDIKYAFYDDKYKLINQASYKIKNKNEQYQYIKEEKQKIDELYKHNIKSFKQLLELHDHNLRFYTKLTVDIIYLYNNIKNIDYVIQTAATVEYILAEILELAGNLTKKIDSKHITKAITDDQELKEVFTNCHQQKDKLHKNSIIKVLSQVHPDHKISEQAIEKLSELLNCFIYKMTKQYNQNVTFKDAIDTILLGELASHAISQSKKALEKFHDHASDTEGFLHRKIL